MRAHTKLSAFELSDVDKVRLKMVKDSCFSYYSTRVSAKIEIAIGIEIGSGNVKRKSISIAISTPIPILNHNFHETRKLSY